MTVTIKRIFILFVALFLICISPSIYALCRWAFSPRDTFSGRPVSLPWLWVTDEPSSDPRAKSWIRPRATLLSTFEDSVSVDHPYKDPGASIVKDQWFRIYGVMADDDPLASEVHKSIEGTNIQCGAIRRNPNSDQIAVGCFSQTHETTWSYTGSAAHLSAGLKIIKQVLQ